MFLAQFAVTLTGAKGMVKCAPSAPRVAVFSLPSVGSFQVTVQPDRLMPASVAPGTLTVTVPKACEGPALPVQVPVAEPLVPRS